MSYSIEIERLMKYVKKNYAKNFMKHKVLMSVAGFTSDDMYSLGLMALTQISSQKFKNYSHSEATLCLKWQQLIKTQYIKFNCNKRQGQVYHLEPAMMNVLEDLNPTYSEDLSVDKFVDFLKNTDAEKYKIVKKMMYKLKKTSIKNIEKVKNDYKNEFLTIKSSFDEFMLNNQ